MNLQTAWTAVAGQARPRAAARRMVAAAALALAAWVAAAPSWARAAQDARLNAVASFSIVGDMVARIGGDHIALATIVGRGGDAHAFEPRPGDARALAKAQLLFVNGLDFEAWLPRLLASSSFRGRIVVVSQGVVPRRLDEGAASQHGASAAEATDATDATDGAAGAAHAHEHAGDAASNGVSAVGRAGVLDPHAWQSLRNGMVYARNIAQALIEADPAHAADYGRRLEAYLADMRELDAALRRKLDAIPTERRRVVTSHESFGYFARDYGVRFVSVVGLSSDAEPSAKELASLIQSLKGSHGAAVFLEKAVNPRLARQMARETGATLGGVLYSDTLAEPGQPADSYLGMFEWNVDQLVKALGGDGGR